jgi:hypothetical protein
MRRTPSILRPAPRAHRRARRGFALMDAIIAGVILSVGMLTVLSMGGQALALTRRGEIDVRAAAALDELLASVLTEGPIAFPDLHPLSGRFDGASPYADFTYGIEIEQGGSGVPALVRVTLVHETGRSYDIETFVAEKRGEEPDPIRTPYEPIDREGRIAEKQEARDGA